MEVALKGFMVRISLPSAVAALGMVNAKMAVLVFAVWVTVTVTLALAATDPPLVDADMLTVNSEGVNASVLSLLLYTFELNTTVACVFVALAVARVNVGCANVLNPDKNKIQTNE